MEKFILNEEKIYFFHCKREKKSFEKQKSKKNNLSYIKYKKKREKRKEKRRHIHNIIQHNTDNKIK